MKHILAVVVAAVAVATGAQTVTKLVYTTVDAVKMDYQAILITGVQEGATTATTASVYCSSTSCSDQLEKCQKLALLAMTKPGQYVFEIEKYSSQTFDRCTLRRVAP